MNKISNSHRLEHGETELLRRMRNGDDDAFRDMVNRYKNRLFASVLLHTRCKDLAEEVVQETFIRAFLNLPHFRGESQFFTWLFRIAWNTRVNYKRRFHRECQPDPDQIQPTALAPESDQPDAPVERRERSEVIERALGRIESHHRTILLLREFDGLSYQQIAETMQIPIGTVRSRLSRARERFRSELASEELCDV